MCLIEKVTLLLYSNPLVELWFGRGSRRAWKKLPRADPRLRGGLLRPMAPSTFGRMSMADRSWSLL